MGKKIYLKSVIGYREDTLENWVLHNPLLEKGEPSIVNNSVDGNWLKIGDGVTKWIDLPYKKWSDGSNIQIDQTFSPESENAQSGKAVAEALEPFDRQYELIETVTVAEEGITSITRNTEPNGKAYSFKDIDIRFTWVNAGTVGKWVKLNVRTNKGSTDMHRVYYSGGKNAKSWIKSILHYGSRIFIMSECSTNISYANNYACIPIATASEKPIEQIIITHEVDIPAGTIIEIWGVRA